MAEKESYSEEELNEMIVWFNNHADELPKEMQINKAAFTPDLKLTVESCIMQAKQCLGNYKMAVSGCSNKSERTLKRRPNKLPFQYPSGNFLYFTSKHTDTSLSLPLCS